MAKIIKKKHWNDFHAPIGPKIPRAPIEFSSETTCIHSQDEDDDGLPLKDIKIPDGFSYKDLYIKNQWSGDKYKLFIYLVEKN